MTNKFRILDYVPELEKAIENGADEAVKDNKGNTYEYYYGERARDTAKAYEDYYD